MPLTTVAAGSELYLHGNGHPDPSHGVMSPEGVQVDSQVTAFGHTGCSDRGREADDHLLPPPPSAPGSGLPLRLASGAAGSARAAGWCGSWRPPLPQPRRKGSQEHPPRTELCLKLSPLGYPACGRWRVCVAFLRTGEEAQREEDEWTTSGRRAGKGRKG